uniref:Uncharacterized protein n=1 Tax=Romanomermis culicivorax TaxID=13658 RepID=A0A915K3Z4_ROMCU
MGSQPFLSMLWETSVVGPTSILELAYKMGYLDKNGKNTHSTDALEKGNVNNESVKLDTLV